MLLGWCLKQKYTHMVSNELKFCLTHNLRTAGTANPVPCPVSMWSNSTGLKSAEECQPCPGGFYCASSGLTEPTGLCSDGYEPDFRHKTDDEYNQQHIVIFSQKVLLCRESRDTHSHRWDLWPHLPRGSLLSCWSHSTCAM